MLCNKHTNHLRYSIYFYRAEEVEHIVSNSLVSSESDPDVALLRILQAMDIFSAGCVIAELFLDGESVFDLSALLKYKSGMDDTVNEV